MDSIDITDSTFSLDIRNLNQVIDSNTMTMGGDTNGDYTMYIYIGVAALVVIIGMFIFKFYQNKKTNESVFDNGEQDCPGGFCTMNKNQRQI